MQVMSERMWSDLPKDVVTLIAERLKKVEHFVAFRAVCTREYFKGIWLRQRKTPYLMLPGKKGKQDTREFYSLYEGEIVASVTAPKFRNTRCLELLGCLLVIQEDGCMCLFDPFSNIDIRLPHQDTFPGYYQPRERHPLFHVQKMVLSSRPSDTSDFIVMIICGSSSLLGFWRPGEEAWNKIDMRLGHFHDITCHNGRFYAVDGLGYVSQFNLEHNNNQQVEGHVLTRLINDGFNYMNKLPSELKKRRYHEVPFSELVVEGCSLIDDGVLSKLPSELSESQGRQVPISPKELIERMKTLYILGTDHGSLLLIAKTSMKWNEDEKRTYNSTTEFQVYEVDVETGLWRKIHSLGNMAIFVGLNSTMYVHASRFHSCIKPNHIYFTDDGWRSYFFCRKKESRTDDMGAYDLKTGKIEQFYQGEHLLSKLSPPTWITPCF